MPPSARASVATRTSPPWRRTLPCLSAAAVPPRARERHGLVRRRERRAGDAGARRVELGHAEAAVRAAVDDDVARRLQGRGAPADVGEELHLVRTMQRARSYAQSIDSGSFFNFEPHFNLQFLCQFAVYSNLVRLCLFIISSLD